LLIKELKRRQALGEFTYVEKIIKVGQPATFPELLINFILGFFLGYKILGVFIVNGALDDPQTFIFSRDGSWTAGLLLGGFFAGLKWWEKHKNKTASPEDRKIRIWPSDRVGDITILAAAAGFIGAKVFDNLENWNRFLQDPIGNLLSPSGLTFYGGLIFAIAAIWYYCRRHKISFIKLADATAPSLMLAYGIGRMGCQVSGDGDWGIPNSNPKPFGWIPNWFWSYDFPHNVNKEGVPIPGCTWGDYCTHLSAAVYPTSLYEIVMALLLFAFLWSIRKKVKVTGRLFAIYLIVNGIERLFIEQIRVNTRYNIFGFHPTQAEIISSGLIIGGILLYIYAPKLWSQKKVLA